jgi:hypothetical protein
MYIKQKYNFHIFERLGHMQQTKIIFILLFFRSFLFFLLFFLRSCLARPIFFFRKNYQNKSKGVFVKHLFKQKILL